MTKPPKIIENAYVIEWAWLDKKPFGIVKYTDESLVSEIYGLAICQYENDSFVYRFSCYKNWETIQDQIYDSISDAKKLIPEQYKNQTTVWQKY